MIQQIFTFLHVFTFLQETKIVSFDDNEDSLIVEPKAHKKNKCIYPVV